MSALLPVATAGILLPEPVGTALTLLGVLVMAVCLLLIPLGLPGGWLMLLVVAVGGLYGKVSLTTLGVLTALVGAAELVEFVAVKVLSGRYGGSRRAFWGAIGGGLLGVLVGTPVPVVGSLVAGVVGTFLGAAFVAFWETRRTRRAARVGWGAVLGRAVAAAVKTAAGVAVLVVGGGALLFG